MSKLVPATSTVFNGLVNPYTGAKVATYMLITSKEPLFQGVSDYQPSDVYPTKESALAAWSRVNGVEGMRRPPYRCAYTGANLMLEKVDGGYAFTHGFNERMFRTREDYLYHMNMRDGKSTYVKEEPVRVDKVTRVEMTDKRKNKTRETQLSEEAVSIAASSMTKHKDLFGDSPTVSMYVGKKGRK